MKNQRQKKQLSAAYEYSVVRLALNTYTFYENCCEDAEIPDNFKEYLVELRQLLSIVFNENKNHNLISSFRGKVMAAMENITAYIDCFQIYEYVLNRKEFSYSPIDEIELTDIEAFVEDTIDYLNESSESYVMGIKVQSIIEQLPIRLTNQKFYQLLHDGLSVYIGSERQNLLNRLYTIRTESMLHLPEGIEHEYLRLQQILLKFQQVDYKNIPYEAYQELVHEMSEASDVLIRDSGFYLLLQELINDCYIIDLCRDYSFLEVNEKMAAQKIIELISAKIAQQDWSGIDLEIEKYLPALEGRQENAYERYMTHLEVVKADPNNLTWKVEQLLSYSPFVEIDNYKYDEEIATKEWVEQMSRNLCQELESLFKKHPKQVVRSMKAKILSNLIMLFQSFDEIEEYVRGSLETCLDLSEREVSIRLLKEMMVDYYELV